MKQAHPLAADAPFHATSSRPWAWAAAALAGIALVGTLDFLTGVEYRVYPLYFLPLSLAAWHLGRPGGLGAATLCALCWLASNYVAGMRYSSAAVWLVNFFMQGTAFAIIGLLIATLRGALARESELGRTDALTSLLNRRAFYEEAQLMLARGRRYGHELTIVYIDVDDFKTINDTMGHEHGDTVLRLAADAIRGCIRTGDVSARIGGDEFVVLLPETGRDGAVALVQRLRSLLADTFGSSPTPITVSVGVASFVELPRAVDELVRQADATMYAAKAEGKNRVRLHAGGPVTPSGPRGPGRAQTR